MVQQTAYSEADIKSVSLTPTVSVGAVLSAIDPAALSLSPALSQGASGVVAATASLSPTLSSLLAMTTSPTLSLAPSLAQNVAGVSESASLSLSSGLASLLAFSHTLSASAALTANVGQGISGVTQSVSLALSPALSAFEAFLATLSGTLSIASSLNQGIGGITQALGVAVIPFLAGAISFFEALLGMTATAPSLNVAASLVEAASIAMTPGLLAVGPPLTLSADSGPSGTTVALGVSNLVASGTYDYCFEQGVASVSGARPCPPANQFVATSSGGAPSQTSLTIHGQRGLVVVSDSSGSIVGYSLFTVLPSSTNAAIVLSPDSGPAGTQVTISGTSFTPGATVTISYTNGTVSTNLLRIMTSNEGAFTAVLVIPPSLPGANAVAAMGSDNADAATANFTATNVASYQSTAFALPAGGSFELDDTASTGVKLTITTASAAGGVLTTSSLSQPFFDVSASSMTGASYYDVRFGGTIPGSASATVCFTSGAVTPASLLQYWDGSVWLTVSSTVTGTTICGTVSVSVLTGTNFAVGSAPAGGGAILVPESLQLTPGTEGGPVSFALSGCGVIPLVIAGDGQPHHIAAYPDCTVSVTSAAPHNDAIRYVVAGGNQTLEVSTCGGLGCSSSLNATYYVQVLQNLSYSVVGAAKGYGAPAISALRFGSAFSAPLTTSQTGYWLDASGSMTPPSLLMGSGPQERWSLVPSSAGSLSLETPNSVVLAYALQYPVGFGVSPSGAGTTSFSGTNWFNASSTVEVTASPSAGFDFSGWVSSTGNVTLGDPASAATSATVGGADTLTGVFVAATTRTSTSSSTSTSASSSSTTSSSTSVSSSSSTTRGSSSRSSSASTSTATVVTSSSTASAPAGSLPFTFYLIIAALAAIVVAVAMLMVSRRRKSR